MPLAFYTIVYLTGYSLKDARNDGWLFANDSSTDVADLRDVVALYDLDRVSWRALPQLFPIWCSMVVVVGFSWHLVAVAICCQRPLRSSVAEHFKITRWLLQFLLVVANLSLVLRDKTSH